MHAIWALIPLLPFQFDECRFSAAREARVNASAVSELNISAGAGFLHIIGRPGLREIRIRGSACASDRDLLDAIQLRTVRTGSVVHVYSFEAAPGFDGEEYARLDILIEVPQGIATTLDDSSGDVEVKGVGGLVLRDGSGGIRVDDIRGSIDIVDKSGKIRISGVKGEVHIEDSSGDILVSHVERDVVISDLSGSIEVDRVDGGLTVTADGSGSIKHSGVRGAVQLPRERDERRLGRRGR